MWIISLVLTEGIRIASSRRSAGLAAAGIILLTFSALSEILMSLENKPSFTYFIVRKRAAAILYSSEYA